MFPALVRHLAVAVVAEVVTATLVLGLTAVLVVVLVDTPLSL
jgi:hypothetical protein